MDELPRAPLRALVELSRRGTMAAVAERLGYTPGAISQQLARLEAAVGQPLVSRAGRGVRLTDAGRVLAAHAVEVLRAEETALAATRAVGTEVAGPVVVGVFGSTAGALLAPLVLHLARRHPGIVVMSKEVGVDDTAAAVRRGDVDVAFGIDYATAPLPREAEVDLVRLRTERFGLAVSSAPRAERFGLAVSPELRAEPRMRLSEASEWPWILTPAATPFGRAIRDACRAAGFEPRVVHEVTDTAAALLLAARGLGVTPVTPLMRRLVTTDALVVALDDPVERHVVFLRHRADRARPTVAAVTKAARAVAGRPASSTQQR
jgi:DNA-binding transcriptional LysR family regulator